MPGISSTYRCWRVWVVDRCCSRTLTQQGENSYGGLGRGDSQTDCFLIDLFAWIPTKRSRVSIDNARSFSSLFPLVRQNSTKTPLVPLIPRSRHIQPRLVQASNKELREICQKRDYIVSTKHQTYYLSERIAWKGRASHSRRARHDLGSILCCSLTSNGWFQCPMSRV